MKRAKALVAALLASMLTVPVTANSITLNWGDGQTITINTDDYSEDLVKIVQEHQSEIEQALTENGVTQSNAQNAVNQAESAYKDFVSSSGISTTTPYTTAVNGLNDFSEVMTDVLPNSQMQQNVWANAWIGYLVPNVNFGFGVNAGVSALDLSPLIDTAEALGVDMDGVPETLVWPTITADFRVGGFMFPFDVGFTVMSFDSSTVSALGDAIDPVTFDFFMIGGDVRYAILKGGKMKPKVSAGLGLYHTSGSFEVEDDDAGAGLDFSSTTLVLNTQASIKLLFFVPFAGARLMFSSSSVDWHAKANWANILGTSDGAITEALRYGILPSQFSGGSETGMFEHVRPVLFAGFAFDLVAVDITFSGSYDFVSAIPSGAISLRVAWN